MKVWPTIHTLLVQFAPRIAEAEASSSYDERIAIINAVSAHIAGKVEEQIDARLRSMEEALTKIDARRYERLFVDEPWKMDTCKNAYGCGSQEAFEQCSDVARAALQGEGQ